MGRVFDHQLRIGNLVLDSTKNTTVVEGTHELSERVRHGIPLTKKWLLKFGFKNQNNGWDIENHDFGLFDMSHGKLTDIRYNDTRCCPKIKYVHELQNLYFVMTGEEINRGILPEELTNED